MHSKIGDAVSSNGIDSLLPVNTNRWESPRFQMNMDGSYEEVCYQFPLNEFS